MVDKIKLFNPEVFDIFSFMTEEDKKYLEHKIQVLNLEKNEFVYLPQDHSSNVYIIKEGRVKLGSFVSGGKKIVKTVLHPGEIFGLLGLFGEEKRTDFVQIIGNNVVLLVIKVVDMEYVINKNQELQKKIINYVINRFQKIEKRLETIIHKDARSRIIDFLKEMAFEIGEKAATEIYIRNYLTHMDIANLTATSRQTVTTVLNDMREKDLIYFDRTRILIRDLNKLN